MIDPTGRGGALAILRLLRRQSRVDRDKPVLTVFIKRMYTPVRVPRCFARYLSFVRSVELLALLTLFFMLSACAPTSRVVLEPPLPEPRPEGPSAVEHRAPDLDYRLRTEVAEWAGSPHSLGGTTADGIDCSAFVQKVYQRALNLQLPRTTREQVHAGTAVSRRDLRPGDLVFFRPPTMGRHVGIYLNNGEFAHASSSQGVTISDLNQEYWAQSYWTSRRILQDSEPPAVADRSRTIGGGPPPHAPGTTEVEESTRKRIGW